MIDRIEIPKHWEVKKLENLIDVAIGGDWGKDLNHADDSFDLAYCIRGSEMKNWDEEKGSTASLRKVKKSSIENRKLQEGDILVEISGGGPEQPVGRTVLIDKTVLNYEPTIPKICTNFLRLIRPTQDVHSKFLNLYLKFFYRSGEIVKYQGGSNNLRNLKFPDFIRIGIPIPPLLDQEAIVSKIEELFSEVDKGIEEIKIAQQQLVIYKKSIIMNAVTGRLTSNWREQNQNLPTSEIVFEHLQTLLDKAHIAATKDAILTGRRKPKDQRKNKRTTNVESDLPELAATWNYYRLEDVTYLVTDGTHFTPKYQESGVKFLSVKNVRPFYFREEHVKYISQEEHSSLIERCNPQKNDILYTKVGATFGYAAKIKMDYEFSIFVSLCLIKPVHEFLSSDFLEILMNSELVFQQARKRVSGSGVPDLHLIEIRDFKVPLPSIEEQQQIVQEIESRLSVCDKMEETITNSLKQAEALRQSILKKAFEGKLLKEEVAVYKPKSVYFYQTQTLAYISYYSSKHNIEHGEMTIAKYAYLLDKIYKIPTYYTYNRWHLGPYPPEMKKAIKNKKFFKQTDNKIDVADVDALLKYNNRNKEKIASAIDELAEIFSGYSRKERSHKTELLATVCKVVEDIKSVELRVVRQSMKEWVIELSTTKFKNKAEKFSEEETTDCLQFIVKKGWSKILLGD